MPNWLAPNTEGETHAFERGVMSLGYTKSDRRFLFRDFADRFVRLVIRIGGTTVLFVVVLIFLYFLYKLLPLLESPSLEKYQQTSIVLPSVEDEKYLYYGADEYESILFALRSDGFIEYFDLINQSELSGERISDLPITAFSRVERNPESYVVALSDRSVILLEHHFEISYPQHRRTVTPRLQRPWQKLVVDIETPIEKIVARENEQSLTLSIYSNGQLFVFYYTKQQGLFDDTPSFKLFKTVPITVPHSVEYLMLDSDARWLIAASNNGKFTTYPMYADEPENQGQTHQLEDGAKITDAEWLLGDISLLLGTSQGKIEQWFPVAKNKKKRYQKIRQFDLYDDAIVQISSESQRKVFSASDASGNVGFYYSSSEATLLKEKVTSESIKDGFFSTWGNKLFLLDEKQSWHVLILTNEHPDASAPQLWSKIHYESHSEPKYLWQSSAATQDFEPKFSLTPLAFGTIKAALYAMLFAVPLAILGAIYTAFFMSDRMRRVVKPTIELMEALPTVILGFMAGLWIAPFVEMNLMRLFVMIVVLPVGVLLFAFMSSYLSPLIKKIFLIDNSFIVLIPIIGGLTVLSGYISDPLQDWLFGGDLREYISQEWGISYNQRNALVVGLAMGFAVIPTIFSITEDAVYSVPQNLVNASLAMGASLWQTLYRVVIATASPGIFSAVMIGFGRAVGETMIVLMATGNTPVMEFNIFEGMRTLSANIAIEMPESEVDSTHFRILFLSTFVLFIFTFFFNTIAETVRGRLKKKYAEL